MWLLHLRKSKRTFQKKEVGENELNMHTAPLFDDLTLSTPSTEGIKYTGSKLKLLPHILQLAKGLDARSVIDAFSGTTRVSQAFAKSGYRVVSNDIAVWSEVFATCYLLNRKRRSEYQDLIDHLNAQRPIDGWFTEHYGGHPNEGSAIQADGFKRPWQIHNTRKLDAIREEIDRLQLSRVDRAVALTSLILALDQVDNTLGHYVSYLREWSPRSYKELMLRVPKVFVSTEQHEVFRNDVFDLLDRVSADVAYLDPPYGSNNGKMPPSRVRYASYYHLWTTICLNDKPKVFGKAKRREDTKDTYASSVFEEFRRDDENRFLAVKALEELIRKIQARWVVLSYSSGGRATAEELNEVIHASGKLIEIVEVDYKKNVMARMKWTNEWVNDAEKTSTEFLFLIEKK